MPAIIGGRGYGVVSFPDLQSRRGTVEAEPAKKAGGSPQGHWRGGKRGPAVSAH